MKNLDQTNDVFAQHKKACELLTAGNVPDLPDPQAEKERRQMRLAEVVRFSTEKKKLVKRLLKKEYASSLVPLLPEPEGGGREELFPLAFAQQRYWLIDQLDPGTAAYNISFGLRVKGNLNVEALTRSLHEIVRRHEPLRTAFFTVDGIPMQRICPPSNVPVPFIDLRPLSIEQQQEEEQRLLNQEFGASIDLRQGLLLRAILIQLADTSFTLIFNFHHIASDARSIEVFQKELRTLYIAFSQGHSSPLPSLPVRYAEYALWQRRRLQGSLLEQQLSYWKHQLANLPGPLFLPTDRPRPARQTFNGDLYCFSLPSSLLRALQELGQSEGVTPFMILLAAYQILLCRLSGQEDILVGTPIAGPTLDGLDKLIGCFINTIVLRADMKGNLSFRAFLQQVRSVALGAYEHQDIPFEQILHVVRPERDSAYAYTPLFQVMFHCEYLSANSDTDRSIELDMEILEEKNRAGKFDLSLRLKVEDGVALRGEFFYSTDLFDEATIIRFAERLGCLLEAAVAQPDQQIWQLPLIPEPERELLTAWNNVHQEVAPQERERCVHQLFEAQVARTPEAVALVSQGEVFSYARLNQRANQLAHRLRFLGVGPEVLVGLCLPRTADLLIALLAVLKAAGAYVPLDPTHPTEQLAFILKDTQAAVLITQQGQIVGEHHAHVLCLDTDWPVIAQESTANPLTQVQGENTAYVLYTSGSTGKPKGVVVEHKQLVNYTRAISQRIGIAQGSSFAMVQPLTVDSSVTAIYSTLCTGGTLHMISPEHAIDPRELSNYFQCYPIDYLKIAPTHLDALHSSARREHMMPRQCLILGGESSSWNWVNNLKTEHPGCTIFNHYGPTEATVGVTTYLVQQTPDKYSHASTPIGRPLANAQIYILDHFLQLVPIGVSGELYIGGSNIARGYLHDPMLTAEKFVANPFSTEPGTRLYKTGDRARYLPDGNIEFLGRTDDQVKIRGFRVEPNEVQAVLNQHPVVRSAVVLVHENTPDDRHLVAYVVLQEGQTATISDLRTHVLHYLPAHMVPSAFVLLDALPMTAHGKVDRRALPLSDSLRERQEKYLPPRTDIELKLVHIWENLLQTSPIGVHDNFFDRGGNSLAAVRLMAQIQREFQQELPIAVLFQKATPEQLAAELLQRR